VGLLRVHCLLGTDHTALQRLAPIDLGRPGVFQRVIGCHISVMYCYGFASMRMRRYNEPFHPPPSPLPSPLPPPHPPFTPFTPPQPGLTPHFVCSFFSVQQVVLLGCLAAWLLCHLVEEVLVLCWEVLSGTPPLRWPPCPCPGTLTPSKPSTRFSSPSPRRGSSWRLPQLDQILNRNEQLYSLLAICLALCPNGKLVEESVNGQLREKHADKLQRMQRGDLKVFDELFSFACPKFVTPSPPDFSKPLVNYNQVRPPTA